MRPHSQGLGSNISKAKNTKKILILEEDDGEVYAKLSVTNDYGIEMNIHNVPNVRVRSPRPKKDHLRNMAKFWGNDPMYSSGNAWLEKYAKGVNNHIIDQLQDIRKSMKRIQGMVHCIKTAEQIIAENENKT